MHGSSLAVESDTLAWIETHDGGAAMIARVLEGEIDAVRMSLDDAVDTVRGSVVPALRNQDGSEACTCF
jgi:hypothetical protein